MKYKLFIDLDGVLADFDGKVEELTGIRPDRSKPGLEKMMWKAIEDHGRFYADLEPMSDATDLLDWLNAHAKDFTVLTGITTSPGCADQKREWCASWLGQDIPVITCASKDKATEAWKVTPSGTVPVIVDDWTKYQSVWEESGGVFIVHTSAAKSIAKLRELGIPA